MKIETRLLLSLGLVFALVFAFGACSDEAPAGGGDTGSDADADKDSDADSDTNADTDTGSDPVWSYTFCREECTNDSHCLKGGNDVGYVCGIRSRCEFFCSNNAHCPSPKQPDCDMGRGACVCNETSCYEFEQCMPSGWCGCASDEACTLNPEKPVCNTGTGQCVCSETSCPEFEQCMASGRCGCAGDDACTTDPEAPVCSPLSGGCICDETSCGVDGQCLPQKYCGCAAQSWCDTWGQPGSVCNPATGLCECDDDEDCTMPGRNVCVGGACVCGDAAACDEKTPVYDDTTWVCE